jgi:hypothetical protein
MPDPPYPDVRPADARPPDPPPPPRPDWLRRVRPWLEVLHRLLTAIAAAIAIWKGLG